MASIAALIRASGLPAAEAKLLLCHVLGVTSAWLVAHAEQMIDPAARERIESLFSQRRAGEPVAYLVGEREFHGLALSVTRAVLIPRPETELLVELALDAARDGASVLDLGTGSGAVAIALALARPALSITACDVSDAALALARLNAARHGARVALVRSDWFAALEGKKFDLIAGNPPYVASGDAHLEAGDLRFEPRAALEAGPSGLECIEAIAQAARSHLVSGGRLLLEHGYDQGKACEELFARLGYAQIADCRDLAGHPRVISGRFSG